mgnify:CR=1 FL=1
MDTTTTHTTTKFQHDSAKHLSVTAVPLGSRAHFCLHSAVQKLKDSGSASTSMTDKCLELRDDKKCRYADANAVGKLKAEVLVS